MTRIRIFLPLLATLLFPPFVHAQSSLSMSDPTTISKVVNGKAEIERCVILATPQSLAKAREGLAQTKIIEESDKKALSEIIRGVDSILYPAPSPARPSAGAQNVAKKAQGSQGMSSASFSIDPAVESAHNGYSVSLTQLVEASQGKIFAAPKGSEPSFLNEILPALAIFRSGDQEVGRNALGYAQRFSALPEQESVIPGLVRARNERLAGQSAAAYHSYQELLEEYPDLWPARLELGVISLELSRPITALGFLEPLAGSRAEDPAFLLPYSTALYRNGKLAEAEPFIRKALELSPASDDLSLMLAHILMDRNDYQAAQPLIDGYGKKHPADRLYLYLKTLLSKDLGRNEDALKWARKALQAYSGDPEIMILLAGVLFQGPQQGHKEATLLCESAISLLAGAPATDETGLPLYNPMQIAMRREAKELAQRYLLMNAYDRQDWYAAADLLDKSAAAGLDKEVVATILRKSGRYAEALSFSSEWYNEDPALEPAVEAYLRSLAASVSGAGLAAAGNSVSDNGFGLIKALGSTLNAQPALLGLALQLLSGTASKQMRSYLYYLQGSLSADTEKAIDFYRKALIERGDNTEALAALAQAYADKNDKAKALSLIKEARMVGIEDKQIEAQLTALETKLNAPVGQSESTLAGSEGAGAQSGAAASTASDAPQSGAAVSKTAGANPSSPDVALAKQ